MFEHFYKNTVIQRLALEKRWTISDKNKMPIDMADLLSSNGQIIHGAIVNETHCPYLDLWTLVKYIPNAANHAFYLDARTDGVMVLDIEPKCPKEIAEELLQLPAYYGEYSLSGKGYHLILPVPNTFADVFSCINAVKEEHGYYEFLCNHYVTFTRNVLPTGLVPNMGQASYDDFIKIWNQLAVNVDLDKRKSIEAILEEEEETEYSDHIQKILQNEEFAYKKEPSDFYDDMSRYEYGFVSHIYYRLMSTLRKMKLFYSLNEMVWEVFRAATALVPYRAKHDGMRNGMPWLLYLSAKIVGEKYDMDEMKKIKEDDDDKSNDLSSLVEGDSNAIADDYQEDSSAYNIESYLYDDYQEDEKDIEPKQKTDADKSEIDYNEFETASYYNAEYQEDENEKDITQEKETDADNSEINYNEFETSSYYNAEYEEYEDE